MLYDRGKTFFGSWERVLAAALASQNALEETIGKMKTEDHQILIPCPSRFSGS